jgi:hypothetical protein
VTRLGTIVRIGVAGITLDGPVPEGLEPGAVVVAKGPSGQRESVGYLLRARYWGLRVSLDVGYGHGGAAGTPPAWCVGDTLELRGGAA